MRSFFDLLATGVSILGQAMTIAIFLRVLLLWFPLVRAHPLVSFVVLVLLRFVVRLTDPVLVPLRRVMPRVLRFDLIPLIALLLFFWGTPMLVALIRQLGERLDYRFV